MGIYLKIKKENFLDDLKKVIKVVSGSSTLSALQGFLFKTNEKNVEIVGSNGNISRKVFNKGSQIIQEGSILVPGRVLIEVIEKQDDQLIELKENNNALIIKTEKGKTTINLMDVNSFPHIEFDISGKKNIFNSNLIEKINQKIIFAAAENDQRIILNGINIRNKNKKLQVTATNSYRLALMNVENEIEDEFDITFFAKNYRDLFFVSSNSKIDEMEILISSKKINTVIENYITQVKLIESKYPKIDHLIPEKFISSIVINPHRLIEMIEKVTGISGQTPTPVRLTKNGNKTKIESKKNMIGNSVLIEEIDWKGEYHQITFDSKFMIQALKSFDSQEVEIKFADEFKSIVIISKYEPELIQLVLPNRTY